jgi:hypothetical protein
MAEQSKPRFGERSGIYRDIVGKMERALRNDTGCTLSHEQVVAVLRSPAWMLLVEKERQDLLAKYNAADEGGEGRLEE